MARCRGALLLVALSFATSGCGDSDEEPHTCTPGTSRPCPLPDAAMLVEVCVADFRWSGECVTAEDGSPDIPWLAAGDPPVAQPELAPCPDGWSEVTSGTGTVTCVPYATERGLACAADEAHFPGEPACRRIGPSCPADGLVQGLPVDRPSLHVLTGVTPGGDGTRARPFASPAELTWGTLPSGAIVALGVGTYEPVQLPAAVALWGACVDQTILTTDLPGGTWDAVITTSGNDVEVRSVRLLDAAQPGVVPLRGYSLSLQSVVVDGMVDTGVWVSFGGSLVARDLVVRNTRPAATGDFGRGITLAGATGALSHVVAEGNYQTGVFVDTRGTDLLLEDSAVRDTLATGRGLNAQEEPVVRVHRTVFEGNHDMSVFAWGTNTMIELDHVLIRDTRASAFFPSGRGLAFEGAAQGSVARTVIEQSRDVALFTAQAGTSVRLQDTVVRDTRGLDGRRGRGIAVRGSATVVAARTMVESSLDGGVTANEGAHLELEDLRVRDTGVQLEDGEGGRGVGVYDSSMAHLSNVILERNHEIGLVALGAETVVWAEDLLVRDVMAADCSGGICSEDFAAFGAATHQSAMLTIRTASIERSATCGVHVTSAGRMELAHAVVTGNPIGACIQDDGQDLDALSDTVAYRNNETNLQVTSLPIPEAAAPLPTSPR